MDSKGTAKRGLLLLDSRFLPHANQRFPSYENKYHSFGGQRSIQLSYGCLDAALAKAGAWRQPYFSAPSFCFLPVSPIFGAGVLGR